MTSSIVKTRAACFSSEFQSFRRLPPYTILDLVAELYYRVDECDYSGADSAAPLPQRLEQTGAGNLEWLAVIIEQCGARHGVQLNALLLADITIAEEFAEAILKGDTHLANSMRQMYSTGALAAYIEAIDWANTENEIRGKRLQQNHDEGSPGF